MFYRRSSKQEAASLVVAITPAKDCRDSNLKYVPIHAECYSIPNGEQHWVIHPIIDRTRICDSSSSDDESTSSSSSSHCQSPKKNKLHKLLQKLHGSSVVAAVVDPNVKISLDPNQTPRDYPPLRSAVDTVFVR